MEALLGLVCGLVAAAPFVCVARREQPDMGHGIAAVAFAFLLVQGAMVAVRVYSRAMLVPFGVTAVTVFLLAVIVAVAHRELRK